MLSETKNISWGSIIAGVFTVLAISILLSVLGSSLGFTMVDPTADDPVNGIGTAFIIWSVLSFIVSLGLGGYIAGRLASCTGAIHGFLVWATTLIMYVLFSSFLAIGMMKVAGSAIGAVGSATSSMASGIKSTVSEGAAGLGNTVESIFSNVDVDTNISQADVKNNIKKILEDTGIDTLQPDFLKAQLTKSANDVKAAIKQIALDPENADGIISELTNRLKDRSQKITANVDKEAVVNAIQNNTELNRQEAEQVVNNYLKARKNIQQSVEERIAEAQDMLQKANAKYQELKQEAKEQAEQAAKEMAKLSLWSFIALLIGAIISTLGGCCGSRQCKRQYKIA